MSESNELDDATQLSDRTVLSDKTVLSSGHDECSRTEHSEKQCRGKRSREKRHRGRQRGKEHSSAVHLISERRWD